MTEAQKAAEFRMVPGKISGKIQGYKPIPKFQGCKNC